MYSKYVNYLNTKYGKYFMPYMEHSSKLTELGGIDDVFKISVQQIMCDIMVNIFLQIINNNCATISF
jgi:hypothetical protein